jgi:ABC-2 type transport system permease protein
VTARLAANGRAIVMLGRRSVMQTFRRPQLIAPILLFPSLFLAINTGGAGRATELPGFPAVNGFLDFQLAGAMTQSAMLGGLSGGIALALDIEAGFIDRLVASPIARVTIVLGRLAGTAALGAVTGIWFLLVGLLFGAQIEGGVPGALVIVLVTALAACAFGGLAAALAFGAGSLSVVQGTFPLVFVIIFLSSAFFPRNLLEEPAATIADFNPMSFIAEGLREPVISGLSADASLKALGGVALVGAVGTVLTAIAMRHRLRKG